MASWHEPARTQATRKGRFLWFALAAIVGAGTHYTAEAFASFIRSTHALEMEREVPVQEYRPFLGTQPIATMKSVNPKVSPTSLKAVPLFLLGAVALAAMGTKRSGGALAGVTAAMGARVSLTGQNAAHPQKVPVLNTAGEQIGEETLWLRTLSAQTANYVVHQMITIYLYMKVRKFSAYLPRKEEFQGTPKPYKQKGTGRSRQGTRWGMLWGKVWSNTKPHGLDNKRRLKANRTVHQKSISTVLQSKWRTFKIIDDLEDWSEARQHKLETAIRDWTGFDAGKKQTLIIARQIPRKRLHIRRNNKTPTNAAIASPLLMSGRYIPKLVLRPVRDIDYESDGLFQVLKARHIIISRPAFFDLLAKFRNPDGWAFMERRDILVTNMQKLAAEYPFDRKAEIEAARALPKTLEGREAWAAEMRRQLAVEQAK